MQHDSHEPEDPREAGPPGTSGPTRVYRSEDIDVIWDATRCIHVATCLNALPQVFDARRRPWVELSGAAPEQIAEAVRLCPTGALRYEARGAVSPETPEETTTVEVQPNGPFLVRGRVRVQDAQGNVVAEETRIALCRCGASRNKPFCDNSHLAVGFRD